ncbi:hypothetical protein MYX07_04560 [Patescibacteria group bacterium AH-259-L07]|nr:hypothetical protein [Patescibacteria group bacterium AH-259-L07]
MEHIAAYYNWRVAQAPPGEAAGTFPVDRLIWVPRGDEKAFWHELGHAQGRYRTPFFNFYLKWYCFTHPGVKKFSLTSDNPWQMADYYLGELCTIFRGYLFALAWWIRIRMLKRSFKRVDDIKKKE